ncbi:MAG: hypothetical protein ACYC2Y_05315 [Armatimonadota bacterium]
MDEQRSSWPLVVGVTAGVVGSVIAAIWLHSVRAQENRDGQLRNATDIIAQCYDKIKEIESGLESLKNTPLRVRAS